MFLVNYTSLEVKKMARRIGALQRNIQNLSRAINKIDPGLKDNTRGVQFAIGNVKMGINDFTYTKDGVTKKVRYDEIKNLSQYEQASLLNKLSSERYELREKKAFESYKEKGEVSKSFLRTIQKDNPALAESIKELNEALKMPKEDKSEAFKKVEFKQNVYDEAEEFFQRGGTLEKFEFYDVWGTKTGFKQLNSFTWNAYKVMKGLMI